MMRYPKFIFSICLMGVAVSFGQQNGAPPSDRQRERQKDNLFDQKAGGSNSDILKEADEDLGRLRKAKPPENFTFSSDTRLEYDSNALLSSNNGINSMVTVESLNLRYNRDLAQQWKIDAFVRQHFFWFDRSTASDFLGQTTGANLSYQMTDGPRFTFGPSLFRFENTNRGNQTIRGADWNLGVDHSTPFFGGKSSLFYGYQFTYEATRPSFFDRQQHQAFIGWNQSLLRQTLIAQAFYRYAYSDYLSVNRDDQNHLAGLNLIFRINEYISVTGFLNYTQNFSTVGAAEYDNLATGANLNFSYRF